MENLYRLGIRGISQDSNNFVTSLVKHRTLESGRVPAILGVWAREESGSVSTFKSRKCLRGGQGQRNRGRTEEGGEEYAPKGNETTTGSGRLREE
jgi:hypothetical protein